MDQTTEHRVTAYVALAPPVPYFIDATSHSTGRHIKPTKRRIEFRFGFCSFPHLALGYTGAHCRGSEHSVVLIWSLVSGKRRVLVDGYEEYLSHTAHMATQTFCHSFVIPGLQHNFQLVAHANGRSNLYIDGQSVFEMLRIYQLGGPECQRRYPHVYAYAKRVPQEKLKQALTLAPLESECPRRYVEQTPTQIVKEVDDSLSDDEEWDHFSHLQPHDLAEETKMFQVARQRSLRNTFSLNRIDEDVDLIDLSEPPPPSTAPRDEDVSTLGDDSSLGGWGIGPNVPIGHSFAAPPPPTWEQMHREFYPPASRAASTVSGGWGTGPNVPMGHSYAAPPPPTWEQIHCEFRPTASGTASTVSGGWGTGPKLPTAVHSYTAPPPPTWEQVHCEFHPTASGTASTASGGWGAGPNVPPIVNVPPPPTWEQTQAAFGAPPGRRYSE